MTGKRWTDRQTDVQLIRMDCKQLKRAQQASYMLKMKDTSTQGNIWTQVQWHLVIPAEKLPILTNTNNILGGRRERDRKTE